MNNRESLYATILGIRSPWCVTRVELRAAAEEVHVELGLEPLATLRCPECGTAVPGYDTRRRAWRHLDTCQYRTILEASVPRVECPTHGVLQVLVPCADDVISAYPVSSLVNNVRNDGPELIEPAVGQGEANPGAFQLSFEE